MIGVLPKPQLINLPVIQTPEEGFYSPSAPRTNGWIQNIPVFAAQASILPKSEGCVGLILK